MLSWIFLGFDTIIIEGGVNDLQNGRTAKEIEANIDWMVAAAKERGLKVILLTVTPWKGLGSWDPKKQQQI